MNDYTELLNQIPAEAWQYVEAEYQEDDDYTFTRWVENNAELELLKNEDYEN